MKKNKNNKNEEKVAEKASKKKIKKKVIKFSKKIGVLIFYGRKKYTKILFRYLFRDLRCNGGFIDKILIFKNTNVHEDLEFLEFLMNSKYGKYIEVLQGVMKGISGYSQSFDLINSTYNDDWVFLKIDDDIVFVEKDAIVHLANFALLNKTICSGNVINSSHGSFIHDRLGAKFTDGIELHKDKDYASGPLPHTDWNLKVHQNFIKNYYKKNLNKYKFNMFLLEDNRWSINVISWVPSCFENFHLCRDAPGGDEVGVSYDWPKHKKKNCIVYGKKLFVHWAFGFQRPPLETKEGNALYENYLNICRSLTEEYYKI